MVPIKTILYKKIKKESMLELGLHVWWWKHPRMPMWWVGLNSKSVWAGVIFFCLKVAALCIKALLFKKLKNNSLKSLLNLLQYCFHFMFCFFGCKASGISAPWLGTKLTLPVLEGEVLTTGLPIHRLLFVRSRTQAAAESLANKLRTSRKMPG